MSNDSDNVRVAVTGVVAVGTADSTAPTDADSTLDSANEVQTVTITGTPTGGTFTLTYSSQTTGAIAYNASATAVQTALRALSNIGPEDVTVSGSAGGPYTVTFQGALSSTNVDALTATPSLTGGTTPGVTIATPDAGGSGFADLGYVGEDGVTETRDRTTNEIRAWQNGDMVREVVTESNLTYEFTLLETKRETVELYYGGTVDEDGRIVIVPSKTGGRKPFVIDLVDGTEFIRTYIPEGEVTEVGEQVYANGEAVGYPVTIRAYPSEDIQDEDGNNGCAVKWYSSLATA